MTVKRMLLATAAALSLAGCAGGMGGEGLGYGGYSLVRPQSVNVGNGALTVTAPRAWNRADRRLFDNVAWVEDWTLNGPLLDGISFVTALPDDKALVVQKKKDDRQVPKFRSGMTAPEVAAMVESLYRVRGGAVDFRTTALQPRAFLGTSGFQLDYEHLDQDELQRRGRAVGTVIGGKLYMILLDAARSHYFDAALPDFESIVASAQRRK